MHSNQALRAVLIGAVACAVTVPVAAKGLSYSYADVGYQYGDLDAPEDSVDVHSGLVDASFGVLEYAALRAAFRRGRIDIPGEATDLTEFRVGARGHYNVMKPLDVYGEALYFNQKLNGSGDGISSKTEIGGIYEAGFRLQAHKNAEIDLAYRYVSGDMDESFIVAGGVLMLTKNIGVNVNAAFGDDDDEEYFAGLRLDF
jgi:opacity protein-like surface antigen